MLKASKRIGHKGRKSRIVTKESNWITFAHRHLNIRLLERAFVTFNKDFQASVHFITKR